MSKKVALITGFTGQDGTFLTRHLLDEGYTVLGMVRRVSTEPPVRSRGLFDFSKELGSGRLVLVAADLTDLNSLLGLFETRHIDEVYNLAAQSHVGLSFYQPFATIEQNYIGVYNLITAMAKHKHIKFYQASTSEMFGNQPQGTILTEKTPFAPTSPYAEAKLAAYWAVVNERNRGRFAANGILFNHESELRGADFVTQKIIHGLLHWGSTGKPLELGNLEAMRDWGYSGDYVKAMHAMLQADKPDDYVICTGEAHTIREFAQMAAIAMSFMPIEWEGEGLDEVGKIDGQVAIRINPNYYRPNEVPYLRGSSQKAEEILGWKPTVSLKQMIKAMVDYAMWGGSR